ncbi:MAG: D-2-hydroxyacid dehydrogenase [Chloroflexi bacterium]|nr:D-2-hydroxyacid dehydrogenase [Chloroflexota bacterium]
MGFKLVMVPPQRPQTRAWAARVMDTVSGVNVVLPETEADTRRELRDADAAFGTLTPDLLKAAGKLKWLQAPAAAPAAGYYFKELVEHPVVVTNFREIYNDHISTHIMAFLLAFARDFHRYIPQQLRRDWKPARDDSGVIHLPEATALIIGVGGIGGEAARHCAHFGMKVIGIDARRKDRPEGVAELYGPDQLDRHLPRADFVIMTIPHTPQTEGLMNEARFRLMKKTAYLINIGRGMTVKLDDLADAIRNGVIAGAGLDVYEKEPLPADHPLWTMPGVLLTPHTAGFGPYLDDRRAEVLVDNCRRFLENKPLRNVVDKANWF